MSRNPLPELAGLSRLPVGEDRLMLAAGPEARAPQFMRLLWWLPKDCELVFHDRYYPGTREDPGAHVSVRRQGEAFLHALGNHGWTGGDWAPQSPQLLAAWMALNAEAARDEAPMTIEIRTIPRTE